MTGETLPRRLGRYELREKIGINGISVVYRAGLDLDLDGHDPSLFVRTMPLLGPGGEYEELRGDWLEAMRRMMRVSGPHVVELFDLTDEQGVPLVVEAFVEGTSLSALRRRVRERGEWVPWQVAGRVVLDVLDGLQSVHQARDEDGQPLGLVYGSLRAGRVRVSDHGHCLLMDVCDERADAIVAPQGLPLRKQDVGSIPREVLLGEPPSQASDVWHAGLLAWELLAGRQLVAGQSMVEVVKRLMEGTEPAPGLRSVYPEVPDGVEYVVARALRYDPRDRWPSVGQMHDEFASAWAAKGRLADPLGVLSFVEASRAPGAPGVAPPLDEQALAALAGSYRDNAPLAGEASGGQASAPVRETAAGIVQCLRAWLRERRGP